MKTVSPFSARPDLTYFRAMLTGGDRRSIGRADEVAAAVQACPDLFGAVFAAMFDDDPVVRMRAADSIEKITARTPELLQPFMAEFLTRLPDIRQQEVRWHAAQILPRFNLSRVERRTVAIPVLRDYLRDESRIVQTFSLQALADFALSDSVLRLEVVALAERASQNGSPALKSRSRRILAKLRRMHVE